MPIDENDVSRLSMTVRRCDPGRWLTREDAIAVLANVDRLAEAERADMNGDVQWFYMKLKANADHHGLPFELPEPRMHKLYDDYKADLRIYELSGVSLWVACALRNFGLRRSFIQGSGQRG